MGEEEKKPSDKVFGGGNFLVRVVVLQGRSWPPLSAKTKRQQPRKATFAPSPPFVPLLDYTTQ